MESLGRFRPGHKMNAAVANKKAKPAYQTGKLVDAITAMTPAIAAQMTKMTILFCSLMAEYSTSLFLL
jgi:hypothetical protein